jgi:3-phosphoshikimate 1-carboxyvinyltransferase
MRDPLPISPLAGPIDAVVAVPGSKSYTNRALLVAAMADGHSTLTGALFSDDTDRMADSLRRLGIRVEADAAQRRFDVWGTGGRIPASEAELYIGNAGTATRFLTGFLALGHGHYRVDGSEPMRRRPIEPLLAALRALGCRAESELGTGCPPLVVEADGLEGGEVTIPGDTSSQYFTALLQIGPLTRRGVTLHVEGDLVAKPYIDMTASLMSAFGVRMERDAKYQTLVAPGGQQYRAREYHVEPDASTAGYFFALAALTGGKVVTPGLGGGSAQGDLRLLSTLEAMGCSVTRGDDAIEVRGPQRLCGLTVDARDFSDMALTLCALAPFAEGGMEIRGIEHTRHQECDRVTAAVTELRRLGQEVEEFPDGLRITPRPVTPAVVQTYHDHRVAMAFALTGLRAPGVSIADPACVGKSCPEYWDLLDEIRAAVPARPALS